MSGGALGTLFHPFETGAVAMPREGEHVLLLGARPGPGPPAGFAADMALVQDFRPHFLALRASGFDVAPTADGHGYDAALVLLGRHRPENETRLAEALFRVRPHGLVMAAGAKRDGAGSLRKRVAREVALAGHAAKNHGIVFWLFCPREAGECASAGLSTSRDRAVAGRFATAPGSFSSERVDPGSRLLAASLPADIAGTVADFGAGWGYLGVEVASRLGGKETIDLYEAHLPSLEAARRNVAALAPAARCRFFWHDLLSEPVEREYDVIVMNPPFHDGRAADPDIGRSMIAVAAKALKPGGRLFMVANRQLPYEAALETVFAAYGELCRADGFKVLWARR